MPDISSSDVVTQLLAVLREAFEGPPEGSSYFTDHGAESGLFWTLEKRSAAEASKPWAGTTIAAHAHHAAFAMAVSADWIRGNRDRRDWKESWSVVTVDEGAWTRLRQELHERYRELRQAIEGNASRDAETMGSAMGAIAHAAYHLGAIRQKVAAGRQR